MKKLFFIAIAICIYVSSCSKKQVNDQLQKPQTQYNNNSQPANRGDEDHPIVKGKPRDASGNALGDVTYTFTKGLDWFQGVSTVADGCTVTLSGYGLWSVNIAKSGYSSIDKTIDVEDTLTVSIDTLHQ